MGYFDKQAVPSPRKVEDNPPGFPTETCQEIDGVILHLTGNNANNIDHIQNQGFQVYENSEPAPEPIPQGAASIGEILYLGQQWKWSGHDQQPVTLGFPNSDSHDFNANVANWTDMS